MVSSHLFSLANLSCTKGLFLFPLRASRLASPMMTYRTNIKHPDNDAHKHVFVCFFFNPGKNLKGKKENPGEDVSLRAPAREVPFGLQRSEPRATHARVPAGPRQRRALSMRGTGGLPGKSSRGLRLEFRGSSPARAGILQPGSQPLSPASASGAGGRAHGRRHAGEPPAQP